MTQVLKKKQVIKKYSDLVNNNKVNIIKSEKKEILKLITQPKKFSRFTGFNDHELFEFIVKKLGKLENYTEIGCPLWGMQNCKRKNDKKLSHKTRFQFFWGKKL